ncbi:hypothetical protein [Streptomyces sp. NPDC056683]|uniref:hypothetical protein n=1 Tax=Streptomyces sp. NPDC056683 TaxID=3345910 RepID=UPI0036B81456
MQKLARGIAIATASLTLATGALFAGGGSASAAVSPKGHCGPHAYDRLDRFYPWAWNRLTELRKVG